MKGRVIGIQAIGGEGGYVGDEGTVREGAEGRQVFDKGSQGQDLVDVQDEYKVYVDVL